MLYPKVDSLGNLSGQWWVAHTKARFEKAFAWELLHHDVSYFLPMIQRVRISSGRSRKRHVLLPFLPSYVFIRGNEDDRLTAIKTNRLCRIIKVPDQDNLTDELVAIERVLANGVDLGEFGAPSDKQGLRRALGLDAERPLVLQVGRLRTQKDPLAFAEGAAKVLRMCPDAQFALVGDGPLGDRVAAYIQELKLERSVHLVGWVAGASKLMAAADVVTLTSHWEGMPYVLLEAMGWSRPVVATAVNGCPEVVVHGLTGWLVQAGDTAAWARSVASLLNDPVKATEMGVQGRRRLEERFSLQEMISRVETLYRS